MIAPSKHRCAKLGLAFALMAFTSADSAYWERCTPQPREIFSGITYGCELLERTEQGQGILHWVRVELGAPGIELYVTPLDPSAVAQGFQYRLRWIDDVVRNEHLAVAINGTLFTSKPTWRPRLPGDLANGVETVVSDHVTSHFWEHTYLLWFDDDLNPHLRPSKPPEPESFARRNGGLAGKRFGCMTARYGRPATDSPIHERQSESMRSVSCCFWLLRSGRHRILCSNSWPNWGRAMPCCWTAVARPRWPSAKVLGMLQRDRCSEAGVRSRLFSELERADLAHRKAVDWRRRFALEHSSGRKRCFELQR